LPAADEQFLDALGVPWEAVLERNVQRVVIPGFAVPPGFNQQRTTVNLRIDRTYPDTQIDMAYFFPALALADGRPIKATANDAFDGKTWQRWSRHRTSQNPWRPGIDNIETHLLTVRTWLEREVH
jgi:hypothetical protein